MQETRSFDEMMIEHHGSLEAAHARFAVIEDERERQLLQTQRRRRLGQSAWQRRVAFCQHVSWTPWAWCRPGERVQARYVRYWAKGMAHTLREAKAEAIACVRRGWQGWDDSDTFSLHRYLSALLPALLRVLRDHSCSYSDCVSAEDVPLAGDTDDEDAALRRWNAMLTLVIAGFESMECLIELHPRGEEERWHRARFERGMALFTKYFQTLWD
jgi:hypothetical protein